jgi:hypothetical protein
MSLALERVIIVKYLYSTLINVGVIHRGLELEA